MIIYYNTYIYITNDNMPTAPSATYPWYIPFENVGIEISENVGDNFRTELWNSLMGHSLDFKKCLKYEALIDLFGIDDTNLLLWNTSSEDKVN
jgi:hypothetical protein